MSSLNNDIPQGFQMTELGLLPEEWEQANVNDLCSFDRGTEPGSDSYNRDGIGAPFIRVGNIAAQTQELIYTNSPNVKMCVESDILMTFDGSPGVVIRGFKGAYSSGIRRVIPKSPRIYKDFTYFVLKTNTAQQVIEKYTTGVTIKHASKALPHIKIPLPPLPEQKAIARVLSTIQKAIEAQGKIIAAARELKKSLMRHLFTYGPVPVSEAEQVTLKETEIGPVPEHWEVAELGRAVDIVYGIQAPVAHLLDPSIGVPILTNVNVTNDGILDVSTLRYYKIPENKRDRFLLKKGDLLFNWRSGSASHVGKTALFNLDGEYTFSSFILRFRVVADSINSNFLFRYLNHLKGLGFFATNRMQSSVNSVFNASLAARIPVLIPHSPEQQRISQMLTAVDRKIGIEQNRKAAVQALFKTMLHLLMTGKVRIKELEALVV